MDGAAPHLASQELWLLPQSMVMVEGRSMPLPEGPREQLLRYEREAQGLKSYWHLCQSGQPKELNDQCRYIVYLTGALGCGGYVNPL